MPLKTKTIAGRLRPERHAIARTRLAACAWWPAAVLAAALLAAIFACTSPRERALSQARERVGGDPERGEQLIRRYGCGGCHRIPGVEGAAGRSAPSLARLSGESYLPGALPNTPENVIRWIEAPHSVLPATKMPELGIGPADARDIATYLWSLE